VPAIHNTLMQLFYSVLLTIYYLYEMLYIVSDQGVLVVSHIHFLQLSGVEVGHWENGFYVYLFTCFG